MSCAALESSAAGARRNFGEFAVDFMWRSLVLSLFSVMFLTVFHDVFNDFSQFFHRFFTDFSP